PALAVIEPSSWAACSCSSRAASARLRAMGPSFFLDLKRTEGRRAEFAVQPGVAERRPPASRAAPAPRAAGRFPVADEIAEGGGHGRRAGARRLWPATAAAKLHRAGLICARSAAPLS